MYNFTDIEEEVFKRIKSIDRWSIVGAKALSYHGIHRYTNDTDILCHTSSVREILQALRTIGFGVCRQDESHVVATHGGNSFDILITSAMEYSNALQRGDDLYATASGLLDMYLLSDKEQNQFDAVNLIRETDATPSKLVLEIENERYIYFKEESRKDIKTFKPRLLADEFDLEALLSEIDDIE